MDIRQKFGLVIRDLRKKKKISQEQLAESSQLDRTYIGGVERGERNISLLNIEKIANALEVEIHELFQAIHFRREDNDNSDNRLQ